MKARVFAKININLKITGMRGNMHTLDSLMHSVAISDEMSMTVGERGVYMNGEISPNNIVCKVVEQAEKMGLPPVRFDIEKGIPMEAGLGGSSADAACALRLIEKEFGVAMNPISFGSDVHFMVTGGLARVEGVGDMLTDYEPLDLNLVICKGRGGVSTKEAYSLFDREGVSTDVGVVEIIDFLRRGELDKAGKYLFNDLQSVSEIINPEVKRSLDLMRKHTPLALMSGSGSSVFGIFDSKKEAERVQALLTPDVEYVKATTTSPVGVILEID